ncbi:MAG TPA: protein translocase subunit SecF, partial [Pirellulaceae bacterium]
LIYERIREELARGASLRMGIRNGFDRALTTIIDSNVTTLIVAVVLYLIGTADLRGFAVSLTLGLLISMFTAVFCSRVFFEIAERKRWIKGLSMVKLMGKTNIGFLKLGPKATLASVLVILLGLGAVYVRGAKLFDIDFRGGTSVQVALQDPMPIEEVRDKLRDIAEDVWVTQINPKDRPANTVYKVDTSDRSEATVHEKIQAALVDGEGQPLWQSRSMEFSPPTDVKSGSASWPPAPRNRRGVSDRNPESWQFVSGQTPDEAETPGDAVVPPASNTASDVPPAESTGNEGSDPPAPNAEANTDAEISADPADLEVVPGADSSSKKAADSPFRTTSTLKFGDPISARTLRRLIESASDALQITAPQLKFINGAWDGRSDRGYNEWEVQFTSDAATAEQILTHMRQETTQQPLWLASNTIGGQVAEKMRTKAILAIVFSLVAIIAYIWVRFERVAFGFAAVLAVIHDVFVTLGAIALSLWLAKALGFLMVEEFKISLPIIAAFLTLIGYSLNDTIVIFDRMREVKGKSPELTQEMMDLSINQTLSRTILTSLTVFLVVIVLYIFGGEGLHAFAFALLVGVIAGTYSTVFIASPALLWMIRWVKSRAAVPTPRSGRAPSRTAT